MAKRQGVEAHPPFLTLYAMESEVAKRYFRCDYSKYQSEPCWGVCIPLTRGRHMLIDAEDYPKIYNHSWYVVAGNGGNLYACSEKDHVGIRSHRVIMQPPADKQIDHINGDSLDNRKSNLRICTHSENAKNIKLRKPRGSSKYKGVYFRKDRNKWVAMLYYNGFALKFGSFTDEHDAARAYNDAAIKYYGEFASLNIIEQTL